MTILVYPIVACHIIHRVQDTLVFWFLKDGINEICLALQYRINHTALTEMLLNTLFQIVKVETLI